jgi:imidazoleglycerol-phosphate dehydratase
MSDLSRTATITRTTEETDIRVELNLDGSGRSEADTGIGFFDHMLEALGRHAGWDFSITCKGDLQVDQHHSVEDCGIVIGQAVSEALGDKAGIRRFASTVVPLDEAAVEAVLDLSGRSYLIHEVPVPVETINEFEAGLIADFMLAFVGAASCTLHLHLRYGRSPHHICEAEFKALAKALGDACSLSGRSTVPSTKGSL